MRVMRYGAKVATPVGIDSEKAVGQALPMSIDDYRKNMHRFPLALSVELVDPRRHIDQLVAIEMACFPEAMQDHRHDFEEFLDDEYASGLMLLHDGETAGYIMGSHISADNSRLMLETNPFIQENQDFIFYISSIAILEDYRSAMALDFLFHEMVGLLKSIDYRYLSAYFRKRTGLSRVMRSRYCARILHTEENWEETGEPFDYGIIKLSDIPTLSTPLDYFFQALRFVRRKAKGIKNP